MLLGVFVLAGGADNGGAAAAPEKLPPLGPAPAGAANVGPEGVPMPRGKPLGPASSPAPGASRGGVPCGSVEQLTYHVHAHLKLFVNGKPRAIPLGVGIAPPVRITNSARGQFASGGSCFSFLHTHAADGIIHIEAPGPVTFKLGQFFEVWNQRLDRRHLGSVPGRVVAYLDGKRWRGDPRAIPLRKHSQIQLEVGKPHKKPVRIEFPTGL